MNLICMLTDWGDIEKVNFAKKGNSPCAGVMQEILGDCFSEVGFKLIHQSEPNRVLRGHNRLKDILID